MNLPRSCYYYESKKESIAEDVLTSRIEEIIEEFGGYGYRRTTAQLHREGVQVNHKKSYASCVNGDSCVNHDDAILEPLIAIISTGSIPIC